MNILSKKEIKYIYHIADIHIRNTTERNEEYEEVFNELYNELKKEPISLKSLLAPSKTVEFDYPGMEDFKVKLTYLAREELLKLRNKCVTNKFNKKTRAYEEEFDADKFLPQYISAVIKNWTGLKYKYLEELLLVDTSGVDANDCLEFTQDNCEVLMKNSNDLKMIRKTKTA